MFRLQVLHFSKLTDEAFEDVRIFLALRFDDLFGVVFDVVFGVVFDVVFGVVFDVVFDVVWLEYLDFVTEGEYLFFDGF